MKSLSQKLRPQEPFKDFWRPGGSGPAGSYLEPESDLNTCISYKDVLLEDFLVFWYDKMLCFSQKKYFRCARQDGDIKKIPTLNYVSYLCLKTQLWEDHFLHTKKMREKKRKGVS